VAAKINQYRALGIESFIFSGYPHLDECRRVGDMVLPLIEHGRLEIPS
jgi:alkanesulfonate monooxygenase